MDKIQSELTEVDLVYIRANRWNYTSDTFEKHLLNINPNYKEVEKKAEKHFTNKNILNENYS